MKANQRNMLPTVSKCLCHPFPAPGIVVGTVHGRWGTWLSLAKKSECEITVYAHVCYPTYNGSAGPGEG